MYNTARLLQGSLWLVSKSKHYPLSRYFTSNEETAVVKHKMVYFHPTQLPIHSVHDCCVIEVSRVAASRGGLESCTDEI